MRGLLRRLGARSGISVGLVLIVAAVVAVARLAGSDSTTPGAYSRPGPFPSVGVSAGDDGHVDPTASLAADNADIEAATSSFMETWLRRTLSPEAWHLALVPLTTSALAQSLVGVDPVGVPATRVVGESIVTLRSELYAQVTVPVDTGTVELGLFRQGERWLVDSVDWQRA